MKGLMVSLIIVIFAGVSSGVSAAGLQSGEDAAGFRPRLELQPLRGLERPGPDDSEDEVHWPAPTSLLSRNSTTTSNSFVGRQSDSQPANFPAPANAAQNGIIFEVPIDDDAVGKLRQGLLVYAPVDVRDRTNRALSPDVVGKIALFRNANEDKEGMNAVRLEPEPIEPGSRTLRFEIDDQELNRIEQDAFVFSVPDKLRGQFNRVEFIRAGGSVGSQGFSNGVGGGVRGNGGGLTDPNASRFNTNSSKRFESTSNPSKFAEQWAASSPQPGPEFAPGGRQYVGPYIESGIIEARRNQVGPLDSNQNFGQQNFSQQQNFSRQQNDRPTLSTRDRFQVAQREPEMPSKQSPFGSVREPAGNQNTFERPNTFDRQTGFGRQAELDRRNAVNQRSGPTEAELQVAALQQQLAFERAGNEELRGQVGRIAQQRDDFSERLREVNSRVFQQPVENRSTDFRDANSAYWDRGVDLTRPLGTRRSDYQTQVAVPTELAQVEYERRRRILAEQENSQLRQENGSLVADKRNLEDRLDQDQRGGVQHTSYNPGHLQVANANNTFGPNRQIDGVRTERGQIEGVERGSMKGRSNINQNAELAKGAATGRSRSDLIWLLPLLLGSLGLNFFLWIHCRTLDLRYNDLADELRDMVGTSTAV